MKKFFGLSLFVLITTILSVALVIVLKLCAVHPSVGDVWEAPNGKTYMLLPTNVGKEGLMFIKDDPDGFIVGIK